MYIYISLYIFVCVCILFATLRTLFIYLPFLVRYGKKYFLSIVGKSFDILVQLTFML